MPVREIVLSEAAGEAPLPVYDTSGPYTDTTSRSTSRPGLARARIAWVKERGGVEEYDGRAVKPEDNGNVAEQARSPALSRPRTSRCAASTARWSRNTNSPAPASSPRR